MTDFTVFGSSGFIGRHLCAALRAQGYNVTTPQRGEALVQGHDYGHIIYAIGLTGDFRQRPHDVIEAHVSLASSILRTARCSSFLYLSSTRVYRGIPQESVAREDSVLPMAPSLDSTYDYSKLLGESLCMADDRPQVRVARLSNVYGRGMNRALFLGSLLDDLATSGHTTIGGHPQSAKDYISVGAAVEALIAISLHGQHRIYNVASGVNTSHAEIAAAINACGRQADFAPQVGTRQVFPRIAIDRLHALGLHIKAQLLHDLPFLLNPDIKDTL